MILKLGHTYNVGYTSIRIINFIGDKHAIGVCHEELLVGIWDRLTGEHHSENPTELLWDTMDVKDDFIKEFEKIKAELEAVSTKLERIYNAR